MRSTWTPEELAAFVENHERLLAMWSYPDEVCAELRRARRKWIEGVRISAGDRQ